MKYALGASRIHWRAFSNARNVSSYHTHNKIHIDTAHMDCGKAVSNVTLQVDITKWFSVPQEVFTTYYLVSIAITTIMEQISIFSFLTDK